MCSPSCITALSWQRGLHNSMKWYSICSTSFVMKEMQIKTTTYIYIYIANHFGKNIHLCLCVLYIYLYINVSCMRGNKE